MISRRAFVSWIELFTASNFLMSSSNFCFLAYRSEVSFRSLACSSRSIVSVDTSILSPFEKINPLEAINTPKGKSGNLQYIAMTIDNRKLGRPTVMTRMSSSQHSMPLRENLEVRGFIGEANPTPPRKSFTVVKPLQFEIYYSACML